LHGTPFSGFSPGPVMKFLRNFIIWSALSSATPVLATSQGWSTPGEILHGKASWYGVACNGGTRTASGQRLDDWAMTAAHKRLPMGTKVRVTNLENGKSAVVTINDRGPYIEGRIIDVTKGVASKLGFLNRGVVSVQIEVLG
jgi:rare lipoprotein A